MAATRLEVCGFVCFVMTILFASLNVYCDLGPSGNGNNNLSMCFA